MLEKAEPHHLGECFGEEMRSVGNDMTSRKEAAEAGDYSYILGSHNALSSSWVRETLRGSFDVPTRRCVLPVLGMWIGVGEEEVTRLYGLNVQLCMATYLFAIVKELYKAGLLRRSRQTRTHGCHDPWIGIRHHIVIRHYSPSDNVWSYKGGCTVRNMINIPFRNISRFPLLF